MRVALLRIILSIDFKTSEWKQRQRKHLLLTEFNSLWKFKQTNQDEIMETGSISAQLWDELFQPDVLGTLQPTAVIARATIASIRQMKDARALVAKQL